MSIANAAGLTYTGAQVSVGNVSVGESTTSFTGTAANGQDSLTIGTVHGDTVEFTYTVPGAAPITGVGTVLANTDIGFVFSYIDGSTATNFYVSNGPQPADPQYDVARLADEYLGLVYQSPCYCPGTLIRTETGDVPVEALHIGDRLVTVSGEVKAVRWIGTRSYGARFVVARPELRPVRFRAGSLGTDATGVPVPTRDLLVSPRHAMLIDGVLVPAELLVNGRTIVREASRQDVSYIHVELPEHDAIWAENAASESFVDDGSRAMFHNAASFTALYGKAPAVEPVFCAPRVEHGPALDAIRRRLATLDNEGRLAA